MKYGIFGGTFNPVHNGHLINAQIVLERYCLDKILLIPSKIPVHKEVACGVSADDRFEMLRLATAGNRSFDVSRIELDSDKPSYTIYTVETLQKENSEVEYFLIMGDDAYREIATWREYQRLLSMIRVIVMTREGDGRIGDAVTKKTDIQFSENPVIDISSTCIRKRLLEKKTIRYMVPKEVEEYIISRELYNS